jgi:hypothetical protein
MKLCKDCRHARTGDQHPGLRERWDYATCAHPSINIEIIESPIHPVLDKPRKHYCEMARMAAGACGPDGKLFENAIAISDDAPRDDPLSVGETINYRTLQ